VHEVGGTVDPTWLDLDRAGLLVLDRRACLDLLATTGRGRIALTVSALPAILPVRFVLDDERIVVSAGVGSALDRGTDGSVVAFEADGIDEATQAEWSVGVVGVANHITQAHEVKRAVALPLSRWGVERPRQFIALSTEQISGRRSLP
jgi:nitroimidazol reductase NimA-like FMN-containing flavoprotein (pyridoxamine 5'-phosphate oxidase superfamily)